MHAIATVILDAFIILWITLFSVIVESLKSLARIIYPVYKDLSNDVILVTGAGNGIGRLMCLELANYCSTIVGWDVDEKSLKETARLLNDHGHTLHIYVCDVRDQNCIMETARRVVRDVGIVTVLVNNAGVVTARNLLGLAKEDIENCFKVNVFSHFYTVQAFLPHMINSGFAQDSNSVCDAATREPRGHIVSIASVAGIVPGVGLSDYCASKAASLLLSESLELELAQMNLLDKIQVTRVYPFLINTKLFGGCQPKRPWLFPIVDAGYCAHRIVQAIRANERDVYISSRYAVLPLIKCLFPHDTLPELYKIGGAECFLSQMQAQRATSSRTL